MKLRLLSAILLCTFGLWAQPVITDATNGASYLPNGGPGGGIAQGAIFVVKGRNLGPATLVQNAVYPIPIELAGTRMRVTVGATVVDAFMIYSWANQLAGILPSNTPTGTGTVIAIVNGQNSAPFPITVVRSAVGLFTLNSAGTGPAVVTDANYNAITVGSTANPGQALIAWATGLGAAPFADNQPAQAGDLPTQLEVFVGGRPARILYKGRAPACCSALDQIVFEVPDGVEGCGVSLAMRVNGPTGIMSNFTTIAVSRQGRICSDPGGIPLTGGTGGFSGTFSVGSISLSRAGFKLNAPGLGAIDSLTDVGSGAFTRFDFNQLIRSSQVAGTSPGNCVVNVAGGANAPVDPIQPTILDAGPVLNLTGPNGPKQLTKQQSGFYSATLAQSMSGLPSLPPGTPPIPGLPGSSGPPYLEPGDYTVTGTGGAHVGPFTARMRMPAALVWTNQDAINNVPRNMDLRVNWTGGGANDLVFISGASGQSTPRITASFVCMERASAGGFTIPSYVLSALPISEVISGVPTGNLNLSTIGGFDNSFTASGLDYGTFNYSAGTGKQVNYQ
jgi:uncharacterized protein (TIGR03437 family)